MDAIKESGGLVGLNYAVTMLRDDGLDIAATPISEMIRHVDYMVERMGIDHVAIGSDFDGCTVPVEIRDAAGNQNLVAALKTAGYAGEDLAKLARENWLRVLGKAWHE